MTDDETSSFEIFWGRNGIIAVRERVKIAILGAGFGGIGLGAKLTASGERDFVIIERQSDVGGTWQANSYPGSSCDVASLLYSYSFAPNPSWSRTYGQRDEVLAYIRSVAEKYDLISRLQLDTELVHAVWDETSQTWLLDTTNGGYAADIFISAAGLYTDPKLPSISGLNNFRGVTFHSSAWDHDVDLRGKRVCVVGTGASAAQFIPELQQVVRELTVVQRTPVWVVPRMDRKVTGVEKASLRRIPALGKIGRLVWYMILEAFNLASFVNRRFAKPYEAMSRSYMRRQINDPALLEKLLPTYTLGCKRAVFSDQYLKCLTAENVRVLTEPIDRAAEDHVVTASGDVIDVDAIIFATGFQSEPKVFDRIAGTDEVSLASALRSRRETYLGLTKRGFPNFFMMFGPFGISSSQSAVYMLESQCAYILDALRHLAVQDKRRFEVRTEVQSQFYDEVTRRSTETVWVRGGCSSSYLTPGGDNAGLYPNWSFEYRKRTARFDAASYEVR